MRNIFVSGRGGGILIVNVPRNANYENLKNKCMVHFHLSKRLSSIIYLASDEAILSEEQFRSLLNEDDNQELHLKLVIDPSFTYKSIGQTSWDDLDVDR